jgi:alpha-glucosidase
MDRDDPLQGRHGLRPVHNFNQPEVHGVYRDWRKIAESYTPPRLLLGETWVSQLDELMKYYGNNDELQLAFNFPFVFSSFAAGDLAGVVGPTMGALPAGACPVWTASNHDVGRFPSRWCDGHDERTRLALLLLTTLPGTTVLYYGDEIGMLDVDVPRDLQRDEMTLGETGGHGNRDRARTPMQWDGSASAGFTTAARPWLPAGDAAARNVADQRADRGSVLWLCRDLLALRRAELGGQIPPYQELTADGGLWAYRAGGLTVVANLSDQPRTWAGPAGEILLSTGDASSGPADGVTLGPWAGLIAR